MLTADNGVRTEWQSYLGHLAMVKGGGVEAFWTDSELFAARAATSSSPRSWPTASVAAASR